VGFVGDEFAASTVPQASSRTPDGRSQDVTLNAVSVVIRFSVPPQRRQFFGGIRGAT
jgi:hypothetical protein